LCFGIERHQSGGSAQGNERILALPDQGDTQNLPKHARLGKNLQPGPALQLSFAQAILTDQLDQGADFVRIEDPGSARTIHRARVGASPSAAFSGSNQGSKCFH
jgi:hypothetical protein